MDKLLKYREEIDRIDKELCSLFEKRMDICKMIAEYKKENGIAVLDKGREAKVLKIRTEQVSAELKEETEGFFKELMKISKAYQEKIIKED